MLTAPPAAAGILRPRRETKTPGSHEPGVFLCSVQERTANREGGFYSIQFDAGFGVLAEGKGDILGISAMVWIWPQQKIPENTRKP